MSTTTDTRAAAVWRLLDLPLDAVYDHGPGLTVRQYNALRRYFAGPDGTDPVTMGDLVGMRATWQHAEGPRPNLEAEPLDREAAETWFRYHYRDGFTDIRGVGPASGHEIDDAVRAWFRAARAAVLA